MVEVMESTSFKRWVRALRDRGAVARINARLRSLSLGHAGDLRPVGGGILEMRIHHGLGYRVYLMREAAAVVVLCGGDKDSQKRDVSRAGRLAKERRGR